MPTYCFQCVCGKKFERPGSVHRAPNSADCECGKVAGRDICAEQSSRPQPDKVDHWRGHSSRAMGVIATQAAALRKKVAPHGVQVNADGSIVTDSPGAQRHAMKVLGKMTGQGYTYL